MEDHKGHSELIRPDLSPSMADFDEQDYRSYLQGLDLTDAQASELIRVVWSIMRMFIESNLPVDSCGQIGQGLIEQASPESDSVE